MINCVEMSSLQDYYKYPMDFNEVVVEDFKIWLRGNLKVSL